MYIAVGSLAAIENVFPPIPSDIATLILAALFLREGPLEPLALWAAAVLGNGAGAMVPWAVARRFGPRIAQSRIGRRLLPPETVSLVEREYVRFGLPGIFLCRLLPAVRFIVSPFAGLVGIGPVRTFVPLLLATGVWYALIVGGGWLLGGQRDALVHVLRDLNLTLFAVGLVVIGAAVLWYLRRQERIARAAGERLLAAFETAVAEVGRAAPEATPAGPIPLAATVVLLVELAGHDEALDSRALHALENHARDRWGLGPVRRGETKVDYLDAARRAAASADHAARVALAAHVWSLTLADGVLSEHEAALMERIGAFLSLSPAELTEARQRALLVDRPGGA